MVYVAPGLVDASGPDKSKILALNWWFELLSVHPFIFQTRPRV